MRSNFMIVFGFVMAASGGHAMAQPTDDVAGWAQRFAQDALKSDVDAITGTVMQIASPGFNADTIHNVVQNAIEQTDGQTPIYSEQFSEKSVGTFLKRINIAVGYTRNMIFYSVVVFRSADGWRLIQFNIDGNINKILDAPWPG